MKSTLAKLEDRRGRIPATRPDAERIRQVRASLEREGVTVADWAARHDEKAFAVHKVLSGDRPCTMGASHRIAIKLGIKDGELASEPTPEPSSEPAPVPANA